MLLNEIEIFYYIIKFKSFSKAAEHLHVSKSFISKKLTKLESALKTKLVYRSTRKLTLTEAGENFYSYCSKIMIEVNNAETSMRELQEKPSGTLKISVPPALGMHVIAPLLPKFLSQYPEIKLNIQLENQIIDLLESGYDLALRAAKLESSNLIAQKIFSVKQVICATKKYLAEHGTPTVPNDLKNHNIAVYSHAKERHKITLIKDGYKETVSVQGNLITNQLDLIKHTVLNHGGIGILPEFMIIPELDKKKLLPCLDDYIIPQSPIYAIYIERNFIPLKLKCFLSMLKQYLQQYEQI